MAYIRNRDERYQKQLSIIEQIENPSAAKLIDPAESIIEDFLSLHHYNGFREATDEEFRDYCRQRGILPEEK